MSTIANEIYLLQVKWDNNYNNVVNFSTNANFGKYCIEHSKHTFKNSTEIRNNTIIVAVNKYTLENKLVNYLCYRNTTYSSKYFGAFITEISYINDNASQITFTLDIWNTFYYNATLNQCFVEREHINRSEDKIGANTLAEPISVGNKQLFENTSTKIDYGEFRAVLFTNFVIKDNTPTDTIPVNFIVKGNISSYAYSAFDLTTDAGMQALHQCLTNITKAGKSDGILALYYCPKKCWEAVRETLQLTTKGGYIFGGYKPKNAKLYTSQFCTCIVDDGRGGNKEYYFEKMAMQEDGNVLSYALFDYFLMPVPAIHYYLQGYEGIANNYMRNGFFMNFQQGSYNIDTFAKYVGDNTNTLVFNALSQAISTVSQPNNILSNAGSIAGETASFLDIANKPPITSATQGATQFDNYINNNYARAYALALDEQSAKRVDDFLSIYGYATNRVKVPNINNRNIFNYVKTRNCSISGLPANYNYEISQIFNNGVFIWHNAASVGNFDIANNG